jgi:hypothetical protein
MKKIMNSFIIFAVIGLVSMAIQRMFYGTIDENNILQDSIFLPIGAFSLMIAGVLLIIFLIITIISFFKK